MVKKMLTAIKSRLSTLNRKAWHARLAKFAFGKLAFKNTKACPYWWLIVPSSLPVAGLKLLFLAICAVVAICIVIMVSLLYTPFVTACWFCGYTPNSWTVWNWFKKDEDERDVRPYKEGMRFAPWQLSLPLVLLGAFATGLILEPKVLHSGTSAINGVLPIALGILLGIAILAVLGILYRRVAAPFLKRKYSEWCPEISWLESDEEADQTVNAT